MADSRVYKFGDSQLTLAFGDITTSEAQVLVSSDDSYLTMSGGVSAAIRRAGGNAIALDAAKKVPVPLGNVAVTTAGTLPAHHIFHAATIGPSSTAEQMPPTEILRNATRRSMELLDALQLRSIAFPALGAGTAKFSYEEVAARMAEVIADALLNRKRPVDVTIHLFDDSGRKQPFDYIRFFEEFAARAPRVAAHEAPAQPSTNAADAVREHVFISYSHQDKAWLKRLQDMLQPLLRKNSIAFWSDTGIKPGSKWKDEIERALATAKVAILLVSPGFLASDFIAQHELPPLLDKAKQRGVRILWVYVSACLYKETDIAAYQAAHDIAQPLDKLRTAKRNEVLVQICQQIKASVNPQEP
jgi:O-acetyl-ADP-ribose deacetylase (regulator of RNase III)